MDGYWYVDCRSAQKATKDNSPGYEADFAPSATALFLKFKVIDCPSTFGLWKVIKKFIVILFFRGFIHNFIDDDLSRNWVKGESDVFVFILQFEFLEFLDAVGGNGDTWGL